MQRNRSIKRSKLFSVLFILASRRLSAEILQFLCLYHHICKTCSIRPSRSRRRPINSSVLVRLAGIACCRPLHNAGISRFSVVVCFVFFQFSIARLSVPLFLSFHFDLVRPSSRSLHFRRAARTRENYKYFFSLSCAVP